MYRTINWRLEKILLEAFLDKRKPKWYQIINHICWKRFNKNLCKENFTNLLVKCKTNQSIWFWFKGELSERTLAKYGYTKEEFFKLDFFKQKCIQL